MTLQEQIRSNRWRSLVVVAGFFAVVAVVAAAIAVLFDLYLGGFALVGACLWTIFALLRSRGIVGGLTRANASLSPDEMRQVRRLVENVSIAAGLAATPEVRVVDDPAPNAFAAGLRPESSFVGVTTGLLRTMPRRELEAVIAHEIAHVRNRDTYLMTMAAIFVGVIALIADLGFRMTLFGGGRRRDGGAGAIAVVLAMVGLVLAPLAATLMKMALSRRREFLADATAAEVLNDPEAMALALRRLREDTTTIAYAPGSVAHLWIEGPSAQLESDRRGVLAMAGLFNTHPPLEARIAALESAGGFRLPETLPPARPYVGSTDEA